jgi:hypothetical protein
MSDDEIRKAAEAIQAEYDMCERQAGAGYKPAPEALVRAMQQAGIHLGEPAARERDNVEASRCLADHSPHDPHVWNFGSPDDYWCDGWREDERVATKVAALHEAADNMILGREGQPFAGAAQWLHRRADAFAARSHGGWK